MIAWTTFGLSLISNYTLLKMSYGCQVGKESAHTARSACSVDEFSCSIRKLSGCCLKNGWSAKHLVLPALNLCLRSFSLLQQQLLQWFLVGDCVWIVGFMLFSTFSYTAIIFKRPDKLFRSELKVSHLTISRSLLWVLHTNKKEKKNPFGWILSTLLPVLYSALKSLCRRHG